MPQALATAATSPPAPRPLRLDPYVVDTLLPDLVGHDRQPSAFLVYLLFWRLAGAGDAGEGRAVAVALQDVAERTGLSKRGVQDAVAWLVRRRLLRVERASLTAVGTYTVLRPWARGGG